MTSVPGDVGLSAGLGTCEHLNCEAQAQHMIIVAVGYRHVCEEHHPYPEWVKGIARITRDNKARGGRAVSCSGAPGL